MYGDVYVYAGMPVAGIAGQKFKLWTGMRMRLSPLHGVSFQNLGPISAHLNIRCRAITYNIPKRAHIYNNPWVPKSKTPLKGP